MLAPGSVLGALLTCFSRRIASATCASFSGFPVHSTWWLEIWPMPQNPFIIQVPCICVLTVPAASLPKCPLFQDSLLLSGWQATTFFFYLHRNLLTDPQFFHALGTLLTVVKGHCPSPVFIVLRDILVPVE